jgi:hypothetical protein
LSSPTLALLPEPKKLNAKDLPADSLRYQQVSSTKFKEAVVAEAITRWNRDKFRCWRINGDNVEWSFGIRLAIFLLAMRESSCSMSASTTNLLSLRLLNKLRFSTSFYNCKTGSISILLDYPHIN